MSARHIDLVVGSDGVDIIIDDWELFDFVEDHLTEHHDLVFDYFSEGERDGAPIYTMHFEGLTQAERLKAALAELPPDEVERIWALNNP